MSSNYVTITKNCQLQNTVNCLFCAQNLVKEFIKNELQNFKYEMEYF